MRVFDTLSRQTVDFEPRRPQGVQMFVCGPTVYDLSHLGHARTYIAFDMMARFLRFRGYRVFYLQNITDVDDKIIARARELGIAPKALAEKYEVEYHRDMQALGVASVDKYARATDYIPAIVHQIERLIASGFAYVTDAGNAYFEVDRFTDYGKLSGQSTEEMRQHRIEPDTAKKKSYDFSLWKAQKPGEPAWDSPWGRGRPGWHIEDTAITETEFGPQYDLHGGGLDLKFPHHEAEIAQMEAASGLSPLVRYWLHTGFLQSGSEKMSKSLGNFVTIRQALQLASANVWRLLFLRTHYRSPIDYTEELLQQEKASWERIHLAIKTADRILVSIECVEDAPELHPLVVAARSAEARFVEVMEEDFGTPGALATIFDLVSELNRLSGRLEQERGAGDVPAICLARETLERLLGILGFTDLTGAGVQSSDLSARLMELLLELRQRARQSKRFDEADRIRQKLSELNIVLEDHKGETTWRLKD